MGLQRFFSIPFDSRRERGRAAARRISERRARSVDRTADGARRYGIKNFDMAVVFKDFNRPVHRIDCIPIASVDKIKEWLNR